MLRREIKSLSKANDRYRNYRERIEKLAYPPIYIYIYIYLICSKLVEIPTQAGEDSAMKRLIPLSIHR